MSGKLRSYLAAAAFPFVLSRAVMIALIILAHSVTFESVPAREEQSLHPHLSFNLGSALHALRCVWSSADAHWYFEIAESGYAEEPFTAKYPRNWAFFPLWPLLIRAMNVVTHSSVISGVLLANVLFFASLLLIQAVAADRGLSDGPRERLLWLVCFFPMSYFFSSPLTEALFFFLTLAAWLAASRGAWLRAGVLLALLTATRPTGILVLPAFVLFAARRGELFHPRGITAMLLAPVGTVLHAWNLKRLTGNPLAFKHNQPAWGRGEGIELDRVQEIFLNVPQVMGPWIFHWLGFAALALSLAAAVWFIRRRHFAEAWLVAFPICFGVLSGTLLSLPRFLLPLFPLYVFLAAWTDTPRRERAVLAVFAIAFGLMTAMYAHHVTAAMA